MTTIQIDLTKDPEVAALLADKEPGAKVYGCFTVKSLDEQTAVLRIKEMADTASELKTSDDAEEDEEYEEEDTEKKAEPVEEAAPKTRGSRMSAMMSGGM
jgi:acetyl-CoA carboxylase beta subunit